MDANRTLVVSPSGAVLPEELNNNDLSYKGRPLFPAALLDHDNDFTGVNSFPGVQFGVRIVTVDYLATPLDFLILADATLGPITITLPDALGSGQVFRIKKYDASANAVTVQPQSGDLIDADSNVVLEDQFDDLTVFDGRVAFWDKLAGSGQAPQMVVGETPAGAIDGVNVDFSTTADFTSLMVYKNGVRQQESGDYTVTGSSSFQMLFVPQVGDILLVDYGTSSLASNFVKKNPSAPTPTTLNGVISLLQAAGLCALIVLSFILPSSATDFGDIPASADVSTLWIAPGAIGSSVQAWSPQLDSLSGLSYSGNALKVVRVNAGQTAFELATISTSTAWGSISGTLSDQTDLQNALDAKVPTSRTVNGQALTSNITVPSYFYQVMTTTPTISSTGLNTWVNQGSATVIDNATGMTISSPNDASSLALRGRVKSAPATPYTITALVAHTMYNSTTASYSGVSLGWYNGSDKLEVMNHFWAGPDASDTTTIAILDYSDPNTFATAPLTKHGDQFEKFTWYRIADNGTTVSFSYSFDGGFFVTLYSVAKASGYLGSAGYSNIGVFVTPYAYDTAATIMSWTVQ